MTKLLLIIFFIFNFKNIYSQINVKLKLSKENYLVQEAIPAKLIIRNLTGGDLVFNNNENWLEFIITNRSGNYVNKSATFKNQSSFFLSNSSAYEIPIIVNNAYHVNKLGLYTIKAVISSNSLRGSFHSPSIKFRIIEGNTIWKQAIGYNRHEISLINKYNLNMSRSLYFRLKNLKTGLINRTYSLGKYLIVRPPQYFLDNSNKLHVLHLSNPRMFLYTVIDKNGNMNKQEKFFLEQNRIPYLTQSKNGNVFVKGGVTEKEKSIPYEVKEFQKISKRPKNLPNL